MKVRVRMALQNARIMLFDPDDGTRVPIVDDERILRALRAHGYNVSAAIPELREYLFKNENPEVVRNRRRRAANKARRRYIEGTTQLEAALAAQGSDNYHLRSH